MNFLKDLYDDDTLVAFSLKKVIARQVGKARKLKDYIPTEDSDTVLSTIESVLGSLTELSCGICGLAGHSPSYCWLNG